MSGLWVPAPSVESERQRIAIEMMSHQQGVLDEWNRELEKVDRHLSLIRAQPHASNAALRPNFYHLLRCEPGGVPSLIVLEGPDGSFREPGSWMFDLLRSSDLWDPRVVADRDEKQAAALVARDRARAREAEDRQTEILERWQAATRASVSMSDSTPWTQSAGAKKKAA